MVYIKKPSYEFEFILDGMEYLRLIERCGRTSYKSSSKLIDEFRRLGSLPNNDCNIKHRQDFMDVIEAIVEKHYNRFGRNYIRDYPKRSTEDIVKDASALEFVNNIIQLGHTSVLEFGWLVIRFNVNIGYTREQNRHRMTSIIERSTRYCNYSADKFKNQVNVVEPIWFADDPEGMEKWKKGMESAEEYYLSEIIRLEEKAKKIDNVETQKKFISSIPQMARGYLPLDTESEECIGANLREWSESIIRLRASPYAHPSMQQIMYPLQKELRKRIPLIFDYTIKITRELAKDE